MTPEVYTGLKWGALFGGALGILETFFFLLAYQEHNVGSLGDANFVAQILEAVLPFVAGFIATRQASTIRSAWIAGLTAGLIVAVINMISEIVYPMPTDMLIAIGIDPATNLDVVSTIVARLFTIGFGAFFGWLGGQAVQRLQPPGGKNS